MTKDVAIRAFKTFVQAFLGAIAVNGAADITDGNFKKVMFSLAVAGVSAGASAVWNMLLEMSKDGEL